MNQEQKNLRCPHCGGTKTYRNGVCKPGGHRGLCLDCEKYFTINGLRCTYTEAFKKQICEIYNNSKISIRKLARKYQISTATFVNRNKRYKKQQGLDSKE